MRIRRCFWISALIITLAANVRADQDIDTSVLRPVSEQASGPDVRWTGAARSDLIGSYYHLKLIAPGIGWVMWDGRDYWTMDNGAHWKDITRPGSSEKPSCCLFFQSADKRWMVINDLTDAGYWDKLKFDLAYTTDGGKNWWRRPFAFPLKDFGLSEFSHTRKSDDSIRGGVGGIEFVDSQHGSLQIGFATSMISWWSFLMVTDDGGHSWTLAPATPEVQDGGMLLSSPSTGWLCGSNHGNYSKSLYVTRDAAKTWKKVFLKVPDGVLPATAIHYATSDSESDWFTPDTPSNFQVEFTIEYDLPIFADPNHGYLNVTYRFQNPHDPFDNLASEVLFATTDGGLSWKPDRMVTNQDKESAKLYGSSTVVGSDWIFVARASQIPVGKIILVDQPMLTKLGPGERRDARVDIPPGNQPFTAADAISFISPKQGWVIVERAMYSTSDGGASWKQFIPGTSWTLDIPGPPTQTTHRLPNIVPNQSPGHATPLPKPKSP